jgi:hypothetical protein
MISATLTNLGNHLCQAAARRAYANVERLAVTVRAAAEEAARALPAGHPGVAEIASWLKELYKQAEILVRIGRAAQACELRRITFLQRYLPSVDRRAARVKLAL